MCKFFILLKYFNFHPQYSRSDFPPSWMFLAKNQIWVLIIFLYLWLWINYAPYKIHQAIPLIIYSTMQLNHPNMLKFMARFIFLLLLMDFNNSMSCSKSMIVATITMLLNETTFIRIRTWMEVIQCFKGR